MKLQKITAAALAALLVGSLSAPALAKAAPSEKEEVIYILTDASGAVTDIEAVNIFAGGEILDYGDYSAVKPLNTDDVITQDGDTITFSSSADKVYYQGTMESTDIPWNISIRYFLDGQEYAAEDMAGKSGALEIRFSVSKNEDCTGSFYEDYALQAAFTLDTERCRNIVGEGATVANVGSDKQLTYTILPGKGIDTQITADVTDFALEAVTINGVRLSMDIEVDDAALSDKVDEIVSAVDRMDSGASELRDGTGTLYEATGTLDSKVGELHSGVGTLTNGAASLYAGLTEATAKNSTLTAAAYSAYEGLCSAASVALNVQLEANGMEPVTLTPSNYSAVLLGLLAALDADAVYDKAYQSALETVTAQVETQADALYTQAAAQTVLAQLVQEGKSEEDAAAYLETDEGKVAVANAVTAMTDEQKAQLREAYIQQQMASDEVTAQINAAVATVSAAAEQVSALKGQLDSYGAFYQGLTDYTAAVDSAATGAGSLSAGLNTLYGSTGTLQASVGELHTAVGELYGGTEELADGASEFVDKTADIDTQIDDEIESMTASVTGGDSEVVSFVSAKNTNVTAVQFVIKTAAIEKPSTTAADTQAEPSTGFWQKLTALFVK